jgi:hypothetical protein
MVQFFPLPDTKLFKGPANDQNLTLQIVGPKFQHMGDILSPFPQVQ